MSEPTKVKESAHTPAPWRIWKGEAGEMKYFVGADDQGFAHTVGLGEPRDTANAKLIISAPELLAERDQLRERVAELTEILEELVNRCDGEEGIRADGSNIQTMRASAILAKERP